MTRSDARDTLYRVGGVLAAVTTLLLSSVALGRAFADDTPIQGSCENVIYDGKTTAPPGCPTDVTVTAGVRQLTVSWTAPASNGGAAVTSYVVQISTDDGQSWTTVPPAPSAGAGHPPATTDVVSGLTPGTEYFFQVAGVNALGVGNFSTITTPVAPLGGRQTTLTALRNKSVVRGSSTIVRAVLMDVASDVPISGESVALDRRNATTGAWHFVTFAQTNRNGVAAASVAPRRSTNYRWTFTSDSDFTPSTSRVQTVLVRPY